MAAQDLLIRTLVELADSLVDDFDVVELLTLLTDRCVEALEVDDAGLMLAAPVGSDLRVMSSSSAAMFDLELYELQSSEGPCLDSYRSGEPVHNEDLHTTGERWPRFTPAAIAAGFQSVSAVPMRWRGTTIGALNLFRKGPGQLDDADLDAARAFADVATIAILQHKAALDARVVNEQLNQALNSRVILEQAKGMLAERANIDVDEAFDRLRAHARRHNLRLGAVAHDILAGTLTVDDIEPPAPFRGP
ncbi:MAG: GAF and ANTAR domain-containing protein [Acidimicrobiia bacterium]|nr:GAF and ANTAR domain-containing protein [Acidimicrobiia bacterium]